MTAKKSVPEMNLHDLLVIKLQVLYDVETQLVKALPKMAKNSSDEDLKAGFEEHLAQTMGQVNRLERIFAMLDMKPKKLRSESIRGLILDADWVIKNVNGDTALDANLIAAAQSVEHYEIAGYSGAHTWATELGHTEIADLLQETLDEETAAEAKLTELAASRIDHMALPESD